MYNEDLTSLDNLIHSPAACFFKVFVHNFFLALGIITVIDSLRYHTYRIDNIFKAF